MNDEQYSKLIEKLSLALKENNDIEFISPKSKSSEDCGGSATSEAFLITPDLNIDSLDRNKLLLTHTLLHKFYASGSNFITRQEIKELHSAIKSKINHFQFDGLDNG